MKKSSVDHRPTINALADLIRAKTLQMLVSVFLDNEVPREDAERIAAHIEREIRQELEYHFDKRRSAP